MIATLGLVPGPAGAVERDGRPVAVLCKGEPATIVGTTGNDRLRGTAGKDVIVGLSGNDRIRALDGADLLCGGEGKDRLFGGDGDDRLHGERDAVVGDRGGRVLVGDRLDGGLGNDHLDPGHDSRLGGSGGYQEVRFTSESVGVRVDLAAEPVTARGQGEDVLVVLPGTRVVGSNVDDEFLGTEGRDDVTGMAGNDTARLGGGADSWSDGSLRGESTVDDDVVDLGAGRDDAESFAGEDEIIGGFGGDTIWSGSLRPAAIDAGGGKDRLVATLTQAQGGSVDGGAGRDAVHFQRPDEQDSTPLREEVEVPLVVIAVPAGTVETRWESGDVTQDVRAVEEFGVSDHVLLDFHGSDAAETLTGPSYNPLRAWLGGGDDVVQGGRRPDQVDGGDGQDEARAGPGRDTCVAVEIEHSC
ncbi:calcium-binding protein [Nocardioides gansuensis]|uniref:calcium-binding protein n=1 Tax=Nocardioides gansuensis TaxID=2138300 RepID=UPI00105801D1|nr:calcium-binding protein [Nocardioides gansuensis]